MQSDLNGRHYPVNATKKPLGTSFSSIAEDVLSSSPKSIEQVYLSPGETFLAQSYDAHAGLHRAQSSKPGHSEEMGSAGMDLTRRDDSVTPDNTPTPRTEAVLVAGIGSPGYEADSTPKLSPSLALADAVISADNQRTLQERNTDIAVELNDPQLELNNEPLACEQLSKISTSSQRIFDSASVHHSLLEAGYSRTVLATPHRVSGGEDINNIPPAASKTINHSNGECLSKQVKTVNNKTASDGLLEDFIDGF